jgi:hypothetical protein
LGEVTELIPINQFFSNVVGDPTPIFFNTIIFNETYYLLRLASLLGEVNNRVLGLYFFIVFKVSKKNS